MQYLADKQPQPGELVEIANGVMWLTMPLPFELDRRQRKRCGNRYLKSSMAIYPLLSSPTFIPTTSG